MGFLVAPAAVAEPFVHAPNGWDAGWRRARAEASGAVRSVLGWGDSVTQGANATAWRAATGGWFHQVMAAVQARHGDAGQYEPVVNSPKYVTTYAGPEWWTFDASVGTTSWNTWGTGKTLKSATTGALDLATLAFPYPLARLDVLYVDQGTWTYSLNGAGAVTVTGGGTNKLTKLTIGGPLAAGGTFQVKSQAAGSAASICGANLWKDTQKGLFSGAVACSGADAQWYAQSQWPANKFKMWAGGTLDAADVTFDGPPLMPDLAFVSMGLNDANTPYSADQFGYAVRALAWSLRRAVPDCSLVFVTPLNADGYLNESAPNFGWRYWHDYLRTTRDLVDYFNAAWINVHGLWGQAPVSKGYVTGANVHPTQAGHDAIARLAKRLLGVS